MGGVKAKRVISTNKLKNNNNKNIPKNLKTKQLQIHVIQLKNVNRNSTTKKSFAQFDSNQKFNFQSFKAAGKNKIYRFFKFLSTHLDNRAIQNCEEKEEN